MDFEELVARDEAERRRREEREARQRTILHQRIQEVKQEMVDLRRDIDGCITEVEACFNLLLPRFDLPDIYTSTTAAQSDSQDRSVSQDSITTQDKSISQDSTNSQDIDINQDSSSIIQGTNTPGCSSSKNGASSRRRTVSSAGSFVSLSEGSGSEEGEEEEEEAVGQDSGGVTGHSPRQARNVGNSPGSESDSDSEVEWEEVEALCGGEGEVWGADMQEHGLAGRGFSIPVQLSSHVEVEETEDNSSILATLRERKKQLLHHLLPTLNKCLEVRLIV